MKVYSNNKSKQRNTLGTCAAAAVAGVTIWTASTVQAGITHVNHRDTGELTFAQIFSKQYGGTFHVTSHGFNFTNDAGITAVLIDNNKDQLFTMDNGFTASMIAENANFAQDFGYLPGQGGGDTAADFTRVFHVKGQTGVVNKYAGLTTPGGKFRLARRAPVDLVSSSRVRDNSDGADHLVTYMIEGLGVNEPVLALFFEDLNATRADFDYNDLVVEVRGAEITHAPTPAAFGAGVMLLGGMLMRRRRRKRADGV